MDALEFPVRFTSGTADRLEDGSFEYYKQLLAISALTEPHSLPLTPDFGIYDPVFNSVERGQFIIHAARFVPEVEIEQVDTFLDGESGNLISFSFTIREGS